MASHRLRRIATLACTAVLAAFAAPTAGNAADGSWGPYGVRDTDSAVTLRWDNKGNPATSVVPRNANQKLLHTDNKTYDDVNPEINAAYRKHLAEGSATGGLQVTVSQTKNLVNQYVNLTITGVPETTELQVFQCWGGKQGSNTGPEQSSCQMGWNDSSSRMHRKQGSDRTILGTSDWGRNVTASDPNELAAAPFVPIRGEAWAPKTRDFQTTLEPVFENGKPKRDRRGDQIMRNVFNPHFNQLTTNEVDEVQAVGAGTKAVIPFEIQTAFESPALGCGRETKECWLVIVPRVTQDMPAQGDNGDLPLAMSPLSPSMWAQRMQVKLQFRDFRPNCPDTAVLADSTGSEAAEQAMQSWEAPVCVKGSQVTHATQADALARDQQQAEAPMIVTTKPSNGAHHAPLANVAIVVAYNMDYSLDIGSTPSTVTDLRLNARLIAKLLTQSYQYDIEPQGEAVTFDIDALRKNIPFYASSPRSLITDPEFQALNPQYFTGNNPVPIPQDRLMIDAAQSDTATVVWEWLLSDPDGASFLGGCPDPYGNVINPFYSTRTYKGCESKKAELEQKARSLIKNTNTPSVYFDAPMTYPSDNTSFPMPAWQQVRSTKLDVNTGAISYDDTIPAIYNSDHLMRYEGLPTVARNVARAQGKTLSWCDKTLDSSCDPQNGDAGMWKNTTTPPQLIGSRSKFGLTDSANAARYGLKTALICKGTDRNSCIGANIETMQRKVGSFAAPKTASDAPQNTYKGEGYPLTIPLYAAYSSDHLSIPLAKAYNQWLTYATTQGQVQGTAPGELPLGYAPLTPAQVQAAKKTATFLAAWKPKPVQPEPEPSPEPEPEPEPEPAPEPEPELEPEDPGMDEPVMEPEEEPAAEEPAEAPQEPATPEEPSPTGYENPAEEAPAAVGDPGVTPSSPAPWWATGILGTVLLGAIAAAVSRGASRYQKLGHL